jgi:hypothetical protein
MPKKTAPILEFVTQYDSSLGPRVPQRLPNTKCDRSAPGPVISDQLSPGR